MRVRSAFTIVELLVGIGIISVLIGLVLPAIQMARAAAMHGECMNKMKHILLATQSYATEKSGRLPIMNQGLDGSLYCLLLPYLEHGNYYAEVQAGRSVGSAYVMKPFLCPADPTLKHGEKGVCSYACNGQIFTGMPSFARSYADGASNTIAFVEHHAMGGATDRHLTQFDWFHSEPPLELPPFPPYRQATQTVRRASFADQESGDVLPVTDPLTKTSRGSVPGLTFQMRPTPQTFDPRIAQTAHPGGMTVGMGDASFRKIARISEEVYWGLVSPNGGETISQDWD
jgi:competence protein ComGC